MEIKYPVVQWGNPPQFQPYIIQGPLISSESIQRSNEFARKMAEQTEAGYEDLIGAVFKDSFSNEGVQLLKGAAINSNANDLAYQSLESLRKRMVEFAEKVSEDPVGRNQWANDEYRKIKQQFLKERTTGNPARAERFNEVLKQSNEPLKNLNISIMNIDMLNRRFDTILKGLNPTTKKFDLDVFRQKMGRDPELSDLSLSPPKQDSFEILTQYVGQIKADGYSGDRLVTDQKIASQYGIEDIEKFGQFISRSGGQGIPKSKIISGVNLLMKTHPEIILGLKEKAEAVAKAKLIEKETGIKMLDPEDEVAILGRKDEWGKVLAEIYSFYKSENNIVGGGGANRKSGLTKSQALSIINKFKEKPISITGTPNSFEMQADESLSDLIAISGSGILKMRDTNGNWTSVNLSKMKDNLSATITSDGNLSIYAQKWDKSKQKLYNINLLKDAYIKELLKKSDSALTKEEKEIKESYYKLSDLYSHSVRELYNELNLVQDIMDSGTLTDQVTSIAGDNIVKAQKFLESYERNSQEYGMPNYLESPFLNQQFKELEKSSSVKGEEKKNLKLEDKKEEVKEEKKEIKKESPKESVKVPYSPEYVPEKEEKKEEPKSSSSAPPFPIMPTFKSSNPENPVTYKIVPKNPPSKKEDIPYKPAPKIPEQPTAKPPVKKEPEQVPMDPKRKEMIEKLVKKQDSLFKSLKNKNQ